MRRKLPNSDDDSSDDESDIDIVKVKPKKKKRKLNPDKANSKSKSLQKRSRSSVETSTKPAMKKRRSSKITTKEKNITQSSEIPRRNSTPKNELCKLIQKSERTGTLLDHFYSTASKSFSPKYPNTEIFLLVAKPCSGKSTFMRKAFNLREKGPQIETEYFHPKSTDKPMVKSTFKYHKIGEDTFVVGDYSYKEQETRNIGADRLNRAITTGDHLRQFVECKARVGAKYILYETNHLIHDNMKYFRKNFHLWFIHVKLDDSEWRIRFNGDAENQKLKPEERKRKSIFHKSVETNIMKQKCKFPPNFVKKFKNFVKVAQFMDTKGVPIHTIPSKMSDFKPSAIASQQ